ncbi:MAG: M15 family metallopeptidase [Treponema sp.]|nr:M15 family metallopeptidase [Treponema sp.]
MKHTTKFGGLCFLIVFFVFNTALSAVTEEAAQASRAELTMKAFSAAYPSRIGPAEFRGGDWAVQVYGKWFYYAEGRLLPEELRSRTAEYAAHNLYNYSLHLPEWQAPTEEAAARFRLIAENRRQNTMSRSPHFYNALFRAENRSAAWDRVKQIRFLGKPILVHYSILEVLALIEEKILEQSKTKPEIRQWINELGTAEAWNWREIAESSNRSFHSYGVVIDLLPRSLKGLETYWLLTARTNPEWWNVPYSRRYHPPQEVIRIFESYGFIWGGKWLIYDTMHFEYRPEIFIYNNLPLEQFR